MMLLEEDLRERRFARIEHLMRQAAPRTKGVLGEAIGAQDSRGFFEHAGYRPTGRSLCNVLYTGDKRG